jgi:hypothetical protein
MSTLYHSVSLYTRYVVYKVVDIVVVLCAIRGRQINVNYVLLPQYLGAL